MENKHIVYEKREMEALPIEKEGLYNELLVSNGTSNPIYFINQDNTRAIVHPDQNLRNGKVTLFNRVAARTEQKRYLPGQMGKVEKPLSTKIATIDRSEIEKGFCYVEKFNIVFQGKSRFKHPHFRIFKKTDPKQGEYGNKEKKRDKDQCRHEHDQKTIFPIYFRGFIYQITFVYARFHF